MHIAPIVLWLMHDTHLKQEPQVAWSFIVDLSYIWGYKNISDHSHLRLI